MRAGAWGLCVAASLLAWGGLTAAPNDVSVVLELGQDYYYEGDPVLIRLSVRNAGPEVVNNPVVIPLLQGLRVRHVGASQLQPALSGDVQEPNRPAKLGPESFYGSVIDISGMYPQTLKAGHYEMLWEGNGFRSQLLTVRVVPAFDPAADYVADLVTHVGTIRLDLFDDQSPIAVKAFVDLAQSGYYDGLEIHEVRQDQLIAGGEAPAGRTPFVFPAEQSSLPLVAGTVVLRPTEAAPPTNGPGFIILLAPQPALAEQVTVLGQIVQGLETAASLSRVANSGPEGLPAFRPLDTVRIEKVLISKQERPIGALRQGPAAAPGHAKNLLTFSGDHRISRLVESVETGDAEEGGGKGGSPGKTTQKNLDEQSNGRI